MSKHLDTRVSSLEKRGGSGGTLIAILDEREPLVDGKPMVKISFTGVVMPLDEFERLYPDGVVLHVKYDAK